MTSPAPLPPPPAAELRAKVVGRVVLGIVLLTFLLYASIIGLIYLERSIPGELWLAAGNASGALLTLLANSKQDAVAQDVKVVNPPEAPAQVAVADETPADEEVAGNEP